MQTTAAPSAFPPVPTTQILAIGTFVAPLTPEQRKTILTGEVPATARLYLAGKIDQWFVQLLRRRMDPVADKHSGKGCSPVIIGNSEIMAQVPVNRHNRQGSKY